MSSKRKADQVDGCISEQSDDRQQQQGKKHIIVLQHSAHRTAASNNADATHAATSAAPSSAPSQRSPPPSSPRTAPLPAELHTPPAAVDDALLASLTLSPSSSRSLRRKAQRDSGATFSASLPSSPASVRLLTTGRITTRARLLQRDAALATATPSLSQTLARTSPSPKDAASSLATGSTQPSSSLPADPTVDVPSDEASPSTISTSPAAKLEAAEAGEATAAATCSACLLSPAASSSPSAAAPTAGSAASSRSSHTHALNVDSAIRGMQGISLSSLSFHSLSPSISNHQQDVAQPALLAPPAAPSSAPSTVRPAVAAALPLIRLTLNYSGVRRTASTESAQGNLKKHKRSSVLSPPPPPPPPIPRLPQPPPAADVAEQRIGSTARQMLQPRPEAAVEDQQPKLLRVSEQEAAEAVEAQSLPLRYTSPPSARDEEEASVGSLETAVSASSVRGHSRSSSSCSSSVSASACAASIRCEVCNLELSSLAQLSGHQQGRRHQHQRLMRESGGGFSCQLCQKVFTCAADQQKHAEGEKHREMLELTEKGEAGQRRGQFVLACELCGVTFTGLTQRRQHLDGKKHIAAVRQYERNNGDTGGREAEGKEDGKEEGKERRKRDDSKGRDGGDADCMAASKKRKYGRCSPAVSQQQPSPTPRRIQLLSSSPFKPSAAFPSPPAATSAQQTIRYITSAPAGLQQQQQHAVMRLSMSSSRSVSVSSVDSGGSSEPGPSVDAEGGAATRRHLHYHEGQPPARDAKLEPDTESGSCSSSVSSHELTQPSPQQEYEADTYLPYATYPPHAAAAPHYFYPPHFHPQVQYAAYPPPAMYPMYAPPPAGYYPHPQYMPAAPPPAAANFSAPMFAYLSPSAAAALNGPVVPSLTPITVLYPTELLLSQPYAAHQFGYPPLYLLPPPSLSTEQAPTDDSFAAPNAALKQHEAVNADAAGDGEESEETAQEVPKKQPSLPSVSQQLSQQAVDSEAGGTAGQQDSRAALSVDAAA